MHPCYQILAYYFFINTPVSKGCKNTAAPKHANRITQTAIKIKRLYSFSKKD